MEAAVRLVNEAGLSYGFVQQSGPRNHWFSLSAIARAACEPLRVRTSVFGLSGFGLLGHGVFSFSAPLSRAPKAGGTRLPDAALAGEPNKISSCRSIFSGGPPTEGSRQVGKAEPAPAGRRVVAQLPCPRERGRKTRATEREKEKGRLMAKGGAARKGRRSFVAPGTNEGP
jgi:hypothetical protein